MEIPEMNIGQRCAEKIEQMLLFDFDNVTRKDIATIINQEVQPLIETLERIANSKPFQSNISPSIEARAALDAVRHKDKS